MKTLGIALGYTDEVWRVTKKNMQDHDGYGFELNGNGGYRVTLISPERRRMTEIEEQIRILQAEKKALQEKANLSPTE